MTLQVATEVVATAAVGAAATVVVVVVMAAAVGVAVTGAEATEDGETGATGETRAPTEEEDTTNTRLTVKLRIAPIGVIQDCVSLPFALYNTNTYMYPYALTFCT